MILCGPGRQLSPFSKVRSTGIPKSLLPVANLPMVDYVLDFCENAFFSKITLVCDDESADAIKEALKIYKTAKKSGENGQSEAILSFTNCIDVVVASTSNSGEILLLLHKKNLLGLFEHFVLLPCDFVTNLPPQVLVEAYRSRRESDIGMLVYYKNQLQIEDKKFKIFPKSYTIYSEDAGQGQLLDYYSSEDVEFHNALKIRTQLMWQHANATVSTRLLNSGIIFGSAKQIFKVMEDHPTKFTETYFSSRPIIKVIRDLARIPWQTTSSKHTFGFMVLPHQAQFIRSNNLPVLLEANRHFLKLQAQSGRQANKEKTLANVGADSMIGDHTVLGEKTNVKLTVIGANCTIGKRAKLNGCVILDNVTVEDDVQLDNCIVGHDVVIHNKAKLINCYVELTQEIAKGTSAKGETLLCFTLEGLVDDGELAIESSLEGDYSSDYDELDDEFDNSDGLFAR